jgi:nicotinate-nucleotide--dimethylbenzimidazole phosphoribosyltransferase
MAVDLVDAGIGTVRGDLVTTDALDEATYAALLALGRARGAVAARTGPVALGEIGIGNTTVAAALAAALLGRPAGDVVGRGSSADASMIERKADVVARALARVGRVGPEQALRRLGGGELAVLTGVVLGAAEAGGVVLLDGLATSVCALAAVRMEPAAAAHLVAGHRSRERAHALVLTELGLEPLLDLRIRTGEGVGAALATGLLKDALRLRREVARTVRVET